MYKAARSCANSVRELKSVVEQYETYENNDGAISYWQRTRIVNRRYLIYRWAQFLLHAFYSLMSIIEIGRQYHRKMLQLQFVKSTKYYAKWFLYLTHWGLVLNLTQAFLALCIVRKAYSAQNDNSTNINLVSPYLLQIYLRLFVVAVNLSVYIAVGYWFWVFDPSDSLVDLLTLSEHGFGAFFLIVDLFVVGIPYKVFYGLYTMILALFYLSITYAHHLLGALDRFQDKRYLYEKNDWYRPYVVVVYFSLSLVVMFSFNLMLWALYLLKRHLKLKFRGRRSRGHSEMAV